VTVRGWSRARRFDRLDRLDDVIVTSAAVRLKGGPVPVSPQIRVDNDALGALHGERDRLIGVSFLPYLRADACWVKASVSGWTRANVKPGPDSIRVCGDRVGSPMATDCRAPFMRLAGAFEAAFGMSQRERQELVAAMQMEWLEHHTRTGSPSRPAGKSG
jgi:hypothetical protein